MSYLPSSKFGSCTQCGAKSVPCVKIGKVLICCVCNRNNKNGVQISKAKKRDAEREKAIKELKPKEKRSLKRSVASSVRSLADTPQNKENLSKSKLLKLADAAFSRFIRNRDKDKNGNIACVCCGKIYNIENVDKDGNRIVQCLHFIKRSIYSLRFSEHNCAAGCTWCNNDMDKNPTGKAYQQFKEKLIADLGEQEVAEMEIAHRRINMLEAQHLKNIIEHYNV